MKKNSYMLAALAILVVIGCSGKDAKKMDDERILMQDTTDKQGIQRMQVSKFEQTVKFKGKEYKVSLHRAPDDGLPRVESETGSIFVDNSITLRITRGNENIINKVFTKQSFSSVVPADFMKKSMLEGMVFDKITNQGIVFAVSVSYPQTDLYMPISMTVSESGKTLIVLEEVIEYISTDEDLTE